MTAPPAEPEMEIAVILEKDLGLGQRVASFRIYHGSGKRAPRGNGGSWELGGGLSERQDA